MKKKISRILAVVMAMLVAIGTLNVSVFASESNQGVIFNHGSISVTSEQANEDSVIALSAVGDTATVNVSPFAHMQWLGCQGDWCPDGCGTGCFVTGYGCSCFTDNTLRTASVQVTIADENVVTAGEAVADGDTSTLTAPPQTMDGSLVLTAVGQGETTVTVLVTLCDWLAFTRVFAVGVGKSVSEITVPTQPDNTPVVDDDDDDDDSQDPAATLVKVADYSAYTNYDEETKANTLYLSLIYPEAMSIVDADALKSEINIKVGDIQHTVKSVSLSEDGKTLNIETIGWGAGKTYRLVSQGTLNNLVSVASGVAADSMAIFYVPSGPTLSIQEQVVATAETPASITTKLVKEAGTSRGMVHFILLKNGEPATSLSENGATATTHFHDITFTAEQFVANAFGETGPIQVALAGQYTVSYDGADITITALNSEVGDVLDLHIVSYLNTNNANVDKTALQAAAAAAQEVDLSATTEAKAKNLTDKLTAAKAALASGYYAQTDVDFAAEQLTEAIKNSDKYSELQSEHNYGDNVDETYVYTEDGAENGIYVTFSEETRVESNYDFIYILDGEDNEIGTFTGTELAGKTVYIPTATVKVRLTSDRSGNYYGFKVTDVEPVGEAIDLGKVAEIDSVKPIAVGASLETVVTVNGAQLVENEDYTLEYSSNAIGTFEVVISGAGKYTGSLSVPFSVYDPENEDSLLDGATVNASQIALRQAWETGTSYVSFSNVPSAWMDSITSITLTPVNSDGSAVDTGDAEYPKAPKEITLTKDQIQASGSNITFTRTEDDPVVYVMMGHEPLEVSGRWSTNVYPQSQIYNVTVEATGYKTTTGQVTYYTGTAPDFSIIIDEDGNSSTLDDQRVAYTWSAADIETLATFANGSSQCGMTGFRTFTTEGVSIKELLEIAEVEVFETDSYLLDTSDHYGNSLTYEELFGSPRYFMSAIYDEDFVAKYQEIVETDSAAGSSIELRRYLAERALEENSVIDPRISTSYVETYIAADDIDDLELPTEENTKFNSLVAYENQFRFTPGIPLVQEEVTLSFDSQGGSEVEPQTVLTHWLTSTVNTTRKSSYWANSLVIYRNAANPSTEDSTAADTMTAPENPVREGYVFAGWYADAEYTEEFDFTADGGKVDVDTTVYAKWIAEEDAVTLSGLSVESVEHDDADAELNQGIIFTLTFNKAIALADEFDVTKDLAITIAGGNVANTARSVTAEVVNENQLKVTLNSTGWVAIYNGVLGVSLTETGKENIKGANGETVIMEAQSERIPIGIKLQNNVKEATADQAAVTYVNVDHKANMRGMYHFQLISIDAEENETVLGQSTSHAHNFYTSITEDTIANAISNAVNNVEGYYTVYTGGTDFVVKAENAVAGEKLVVRMLENGASDTIIDTHNHIIEQTIENEDTEAGTYVLVDKCAFCGEEMRRDSLTYKLSIEEENIEVATENKYSLSVIKNMGSHEVTFTSSNEKVATVDDKGLVTALTYGKVTITASALDGKYTDSVEVQTRFYDVLQSDVDAGTISAGNYKSIYWGADNGYVRGYDEGVYFAPANSITRAEMIVFLYRLAGRPAVDTSKVPSFTDVSKDDLSAGAYKAIQWAEQSGIVKGFEDGSLGINEPTTRAQMVVFLYRIAGRPVVDSSKAVSFSDVSTSTISAGAYKSMQWANQNGIVRGYSDGTFKPDAECDRASTVTFMYRYKKIY